MAEPIKLGIQWSPDFQSRTEAGFKRLQKEADGEFLRLVTPYGPKRTGALAGSAKISTVLGSGEIRGMEALARTAFRKSSVTPRSQ